MIPPGAKPECAASPATAGSEPSAISSLTPTAELPDAPLDPWDATINQSFAAELRICRALSKPNPSFRKRDVRLLLHNYGHSQRSDEIVGYLREAAKRVTGGNCTFVDDDLGVLTHLAERAVEAGLTDKLAPDVRLHAEQALNERLVEQPRAEP